MKILLARLRRIWSFIGLAVITLLFVEGGCYLVSVVLLPFGVSYFIGTGLTTILGYLICRQHGGDVGRATGQLYLIDFAMHLAGLFLYITVFDSPIRGGLYFLFESIMIGLGFCKVLALSSLLTYPDQPGWPSLIPFVKTRRIIAGDRLHDMVIRFSVLAMVFLGAWIKWRHLPYELLIYSAPMLILIFIVRSQHHVMSTKAGALPDDALAVAHELDNIADPETRTWMIKATNDAVKRVKAAQGRSAASKKAGDDPEA